MLTIQNLSFHFGSRTMYDEASLHIKPKNRIGVIGFNGAGKTTLLKLIYGQLQPDGGTISKPNDCTIGFLNQDMLSYETGQSILEVTMEAFGDIITLQEDIDQILKEMETNYRDELVGELAKKQERFEAMDGYTAKAKAEAILEGLGFSTADLERPLRNFSGGWRMRVMLAKLLLQKPSVLMLDEPTNHLDLPSIQWLEQYISNYEGAVLIVSHDREFLDRAVNSIVEVAGGKLIQYSGNYTFYLQEREQRMEVQRNAFENQQQKIKQTEQFINRFRAKSTKARQVQSKVKMLEKMDMVDAVHEENPEMNLRFTFKQQSGKIVSEMKNVTKAYGENVIFRDSSLHIERGDKIAFIGANGKGKSTMLRVIDGSEPIQEGETKKGHNVITTFYAQHQLESLTLDNEILDELKQAGSEKTELELRTILGAFLFSGEEVNKKIKVLSGGEKSRVALAKTLISEANFLMLDEPTNHLDIQSVNVLIQALQQYEGTYIVVSHDRHFISHIANKIWYVENQEVKEFPGNYEEFCYFMEQREAEQQGTDSTQSSKPKKEKKQRSDSERKEWQKKVNQTKKKLEKAEELVMELEEKKEALEGELANPEIFSDSKKLQELNATYEQTKSDLETANEDWENLMLELEELEEQDSN
ncbi:ABC-F family ATP-binding cassette domain-containing protein [Limibacter armeniacum]|uniref:ABC-F family ATP-binding cassette domain-containing protein n=1 Tax=Limibacter armeniacum TaxID=466084 RepID=UPI002FE61B8A